MSNQNFLPQFKVSTVTPSRKVLPLVVPVSVPPSFCFLHDPLEVFLVTLIFRSLYFDLSSESGLLVDLVSYTGNRTSVSPRHYQRLVPLELPSTLTTKVIPSSQSKESTIIVVLTISLCKVKHLRFQATRKSTRVGVD